jgi:hypothetical protein
MKDERLVSLLHQMEILLAESLIIAGEAPAVSRAKGKVVAAAISSTRGALPNRITELRDGGFFAQPKTSRDVHGKLNPTYACAPDRVSMALLRLVKRKKLRKASKRVGGKNQVAYAW